jgi:hypothetical protein
VNIFSGGGSDDKVHFAVNFESYLRSGLRGVPGRINADKTILPYLTATERENNALVFYSGNVSRCGSRSCTANSLYYIPVCPSPGEISKVVTLKRKGMTTFVRALIGTGL